MYIVGRIFMERFHVPFNSLPLQNFDELLDIVRGQDELRMDEDGPAIVFHCRTGKTRTTTAMVIAGLIVCHVKVSIAW